MVDDLDATFSFSFAGYQNNKQKLIIIFLKSWILFLPLHHYAILCDGLSHDMNENALKCVFEMFWEVKRLKGR